MKTTTVSVAPYRQDRRKRRRKSKTLRNRVGIHGETKPVSLIHFSENKTNNKILFYSSVTRQHE